MENVNVSKLLSETDLIDILFHTCDVKKNGLVPVSSLITYLEKMTDTKVQHREAVKKLAVCLDPKELNCEVDLETYRQGICAWIEQLGTLFRIGEHQIKIDIDPEKRGSSGYDVVSIPDEDNSGYIDREGSDPWGQIEDLKVTNRRLCQENVKLQTQVDQQEDTIVSISHEKNNLTEKIRRLQEIADLQRSDVASENEELKASVTWYQSQKKEAELRNLHLEKETVALTSQLADCETKLNKSLTDGEKWNKLAKSLQRTVAEQKHVLKEAEEIQKNQEMELSEKKQTIMEVNAKLWELSTQNEELKGNNEELQIHLSQTHQELVRQSLRNQQKSLQRVLSSSQDGSESDDENSDDDDDGEDDDTVRTVPFTLPDFEQPGATTAACSSINTEIRDMLEDGENSLSPLSAKEQSEMLASEDEMWIVADDIDLNDILSQLTDNTMESFMTALTKKCRTGAKRQHVATDGSERPRKTSMRQNGSDSKGTDTRSDCTINAGDQQSRDKANERFKQFLTKVKQLQEENQRLRRNHDASVDSVLNMEGEFNSEVSSADTRIMVLRDILQEERTQKITLQEQVATLKKILGIVDKKDSMDFETVKDTLCRQQDKIEHLKRSNLELAEKYHKAELKITDLQEEAQQAAQKLEKERHKCSKLEDAVSTNTIARQLDLREIWRLVQKDVENEYLDNQDESLISASTEEIKKKIMQEIKDRESRWLHSEFAKDNQNGPDPMSLPLHRTSGYGKVSGHCYGYRCFSHPPSSPLVDALTIDFFNGNYYPISKKSRASATAMDPYLNYLQMSCEDVDCMECRAYRLGLDLQGVASCPSLQLKMSHHDNPASLAYGGFHSVVTALDYNYNSQAAYTNAQARYSDFMDHGKGAVSSFPPPSAATSSSNITSTIGHMVSTSGAGVNAGEPVPYNNTSSNNSAGVTPSTSLSSGRGGSMAESSPSALHRRMDFKAKHSGRWTSGTTDSYMSSSLESGSNSNSDYSGRRPQPTPPASQTGGQVTDHCGSACAPAEPCSPAGFRRMSFLAAVDKSKGKDVDWSRRPSYKAAIDPCYLAGDKADYPAADYFYQPAGVGGGLYASGVDVSRIHGATTATTTYTHGEGRTVTFQLGDVKQASVDSRDSHGQYSSFISSSSLSSSSDSDSVFVPMARVQGSGGSGQPRKLSTLHEEEAEDLQKTPERRSPKLSSSSHGDTHRQSGFFRVSESGNAGNVSSTSHPGSQRSSDSAFRLHGSSGRSAGSSEVKAFLYNSGEEGKVMAAEPACTAGNMPAHFKQRTELAASRTSTSSPASAASPSAPCIVTSAAASASSVSTPSSLPHSLILVPGSPPQTPPQTPRLSHDTHSPSAVPSRLATLRQNNLARKRGQMKAMKLPELSENAESDSELPTNSNGAPPSPSSASAKKPASSSTDSSSVQPGLAPQISVTSNDNDDKCKMDNTTSSDSKDVLRPPSPSDDPVTPSIPDSFLKMLGLAASSSSSGNKKDLNNSDTKETGIDQLPDKQLESRFNSLSLAFKTDRLTLEKRLGIQERSRDIAEQNIDKELQSLRDAVELLNNLCFDERVQEVISKIHHHLDILEHSVARVSSRAEVFGAVQQEKRMCLAMEVMTTFTENIRRLRDKEQSDVEEARKLLNERQISSSLDGLGFGDRRSASVCAALNNPRTTQRCRPSFSNPCPTNPQNNDKVDVNGSEDTRRRSEVALPRYVGGAGSSLHVSSSMESGFQSELSQSSHGSASRSSFADSLEEPRQRFQSATANMVVRNVVTNTLRRASLERQKNLSLQSSTSSEQSSPRNDSVDKSQDKDKEQVKKQHSQEEEAYRHGYEEGLKASLSRELTDLRDQQTNISSNLEQVMDRVDTLQQEDQVESSEIDEAVTKLKDVVVKARLWMSNPNWQSASHTLRKIAAGIIFVIAMAIVVVTFAPLIPGSVELRNHGKPAQ